MHNSAIANELLKRSHVMEAAGVSLYRIQAYRRAAARVFGLERPVREIVAESGVRGLTAIPDIGVSLAKTIAEMASTPLVNSSSESDMSVGGS